MIIILVGGIGSGKTLTAVKEVVDRQQKIYTNFELFNIPHERLKYSQIFDKVETVNSRGDVKETMKVNYNYWNSQTKKGGFDIYLDEFHNIMGSRRSSSKRNVLLSDWLSQIRKILGQSELHNLYLITQKLRRIDINSRDLAQSCIYCFKQVLDEKIPTEIMLEGKLVWKRLPMVLIYKYWFRDSDELMNYELFGMPEPYNITRFIGNYYYKYFDSYALVDFGNEEMV